MTAHPGWTRAGDWWDIASQRLIAAGVIAAMHKLGRI